MKVAILGTGPLALETAMAFNQLEAHVTFFNCPQIENFVQFLTQFEEAQNGQLGIWSEITSIFGRKIVELEFTLSLQVSLKDYLKFYYYPLKKYLENHLDFKNSPVLRVHKAYLKDGEVPKKKTRLADLFRVVYRFTPPKTSFDTIDKKIEQSLQRSIENYEDFDLVIDGRLEFLKALGRGEHLAINQEILDDNEFIIGMNGLDKIFDIKKLAIVSTNEMAPSLFVYLKSRIEDENKRTYFFIDQGNWVESPFVKADLEKLSKIQKQKKEDFMKAIYHWRDQEDYIKAKINCPKEPIPSFKIFENIQIASIDKMDDQRGIFLTLEKACFDNPDFLQTINVDGIIAWKQKDKSNVLDAEQGFYNINDLFDFKEGLDCVMTIERDALKYFSKR